MTGETKSSGKGWEIRVEPTESIPLRRGERPTTGVQVRYRRLGSRGKFKSFVLVGGVPDGYTIFDVVDAREAV